MDKTPQKKTPVPLLISTTALTIFNIAPSSYLSVLEAPPSRRVPCPAESIGFEEEFNLFFQSELPESNASGPQILAPDNAPARQQFRLPSVAVDQGIPQPSMSVYSTSSIDSDSSNFSNPPARRYRVPSFSDMTGHRSTITAAEKEQMIQALNAHRINTLSELRRIEKAFAQLGSSDVAAPMTAAWSYYVNSHGLLTELRGLTKNYPFSSECIEEAKRRVFADPESNRSWNFCWLVLNKIQQEMALGDPTDAQTLGPTTESLSQEQRLPGDKLP